MNIISNNGIRKMFTLMRGKIDLLYGMIINQPFPNYITGINKVPGGVGVTNTYSNSLLKGKKCIVCLFPNSVGSILVTGYAGARGVLNVKSNDQNWGGEIRVFFNPSLGKVDFNVQWIGSSQILENFKLNAILY